MKKNPKVSIIIPAYNEEQTIPKLLKSINKQTYKNIETLVVDDESTDDTVKIAKKYTSNVFSRKHAERSVQRNFGASRSKGDILIFLDADMQLKPKVVEDVVKTMNDKNAKALVIPEKTSGNGFIQKVRKFEREMYEGDSSIEVARAFDRRTFFEYKGYDEKLTGPEDYDLPHRISKKNKIARSKISLYHNEENLTLKKLLKKRFYYAKNGALYAQKHPELVMKQGNLLFRKAYFKSWQKFVHNPFVGVSFILIKFLEATWAVAGYISAVGINGFIRTLLLSFKTR